MTNPSTALPKLSVEAMDATHVTAFKLLETINQAKNEDLCHAVEVFIDHTKEHFEQERLVMVATNFPAIAEHESEHGRILGDIIKFNGAIKRGRASFARQFFKNSLPELLENHIRQVDSALAAHIKLMNAHEPSIQ